MSLSTKTFTVNDALGRAIIDLLTKGKDLPVHPSLVGAPDSQKFSSEAMEALAEWYLFTPIDVVVPPPFPKIVIDEIGRHGNPEALVPADVQDEIEQKVAEAVIHETAATVQDMDKGDYIPSYAFSPAVMHQRIEQRAVETSKVELATFLYNHLLTIKRDFRVIEAKTQEAEHSKKLMVHTFYPAEISIRAATALLKENHGVNPYWMEVFTAFYPQTLNHSLGAAELQLYGHGVQYLSLFSMGILFCHGYQQGKPSSDVSTIQNCLDQQLQVYISLALSSVEGLTSPGLPDYFLSKAKQGISALPPLFNPILMKHFATRPSKPEVDTKNVNQVRLETKDIPSSLSQTGRISTISMFLLGRSAKCLNQVKDEIPREIRLQISHRIR